MIPERFSRTAVLLGESACEKIASARAVVCGVGAVGSFAAEALARTGVGEFELWDFDVVEESNVNRQLCALSSTLGRPKAEVVRDRILDINPAARVEVRAEFIGAENALSVVGNPAEGRIVVDAIDSIASKAALIFSAAEAGVAIVSSMGAARRLDPSHIMSADIIKTFGCPVAARVRKILRSLGCRCVFSDEPAPKSSHLSAGAGVKVVGSCAVVAGVFGLRLAGLALSEISGEK